VRQAVFRRLAVFAGAFSLVAAQRVVADERLSAVDVADALAALVDCSLVSHDAQDPPAYRLLQSTRLFARELLAESGEERAVRLRQLAHCTVWIEDLCSRSGEGDAPASGTERIAADYCNVRGALEWAFNPGGDTGAGAALAVALLPYWQHANEGGEGQRWLERSKAPAAPPLAADGTDAAEPAASHEPAEERTVALLMRRLHAEGVIGTAGLAGIHEAALLALARRLRPDDVRDFDAALKEMHRAVGIASQVVMHHPAVPADDPVSLAAHLDTAAPGEAARPERLVAEALTRAAGHTRIGELDHAVDAIDAALEKLARHRAAQLEAIGDSQRRLLEVGVQQDLLRRDAFAVARRIEAIAALAAPQRPCWSAAYGERLRRFLDEGHAQAINLSLEVAIELSRRRVASAHGDDERYQSHRTLGNALAELGDRESGVESIEEAIDTYRSAIECTPRERAPKEWAGLQNDLAEALRRLGVRTGDATTLAAAVQACEAALEERQRTEAPLEWAQTQHVLGTTRRSLGAREPGNATLHAAVRALEEALKERTPARAPLDWARTQSALGITFSMLARREAGTSRKHMAVRAYREALKTATRSNAPLEWAGVQNCLGIELAAIGELEHDVPTLRAAVAAFRAALSERTRERVPPHWANTQHNLGGALRVLGEREDSAGTLREAVQAFRDALQENTRERAPQSWAASKNDLGIALLALGRREAGLESLQEAVRVLHQALGERTRERGLLPWAMTQSDLAQAQLALGLRRESVPMVRQALALWAEAAEVMSPDTMPAAHDEARTFITSAAEWLRARGEPED
jgi:tetratricopeptide (TPR) repeat protein